MPLDTHKGYHGKILHGYIVHERIRDGYIAVVIAIRAILLCGVIAAIYYAWSMSSSPRLIGIDFFTLAFLFAAMSTIHRIEGKYGRPALRLIRSGKLRSHWDF